MITAIDTNILLDVLLPNAMFVEAAEQRLEDASSSGVVMICDVVYAELCIHFDVQRECDAFLASTDIRVEPLSQEACFLASRVFRTYREQGGRRTRILADFLIGAHAQVQAGCLLSRDRGFYRRLFPSLKLIDPASARG